MITKIADTFKTYEDYKGMYIVENYIRYRDYDTVIFSSSDMLDVEEFLDDNDLWDDYILLEINENGYAYYPEF